MANALGDGFPVQHGAAVLRPIVVLPAGVQFRVFRLLLRSEPCGGVRRPLGLIPIRVDIWLELLNRKRLQHHFFERVERSGRELIEIFSLLLQRRECPLLTCLARVGQLNDG